MFSDIVTKFKEWLSLVLLCDPTKCPWADSGFKSQSFSNVAGTDFFPMFRVSLMALRRWRNFHTLTRLSAPEHFTEFCHRESLKTCMPCDACIYTRQTSYIRLNAVGSIQKWARSRDEFADSLFSDLSVCVCVDIGQNWLIECYVKPVRLWLN